MDRWLARLERRFGRYAPSNLTFWLVGLSGFTYAILYVKPDALQWLILDPSAVARGEVWRLFTFLFLPWGGGTGVLGPLFTIFALLFLYTVGTSLEAEWGAFRYGVYYLIGVLGTIVASLLVGPVTNAYLNLSLILAFATVFPDYEILLFLVLPVKMKWLGLLDAGFLGWAFLSGHANVKAGIAAAMLNYLLFFAGPLWERLRGRAARSVQRRATGFAPEPKRRPRVCAKCGRSEKDDPDLEFRVCDCQEKCHGRLTEYCLDHARAH